MRLLILVAVFIFWGPAALCAFDGAASGNQNPSLCPVLIVPGGSTTTSEGALLSLLTASPSEIGFYQAVLYPLLSRQLEAYFISKRLWDSHARQDAIHDTYLKILEQVQALRISKVPLPDARKLIYHQASRVFYQTLGKREFTCGYVECASNYSVPRSRDLPDIYGNPIRLTSRQLGLLRGLAVHKTASQMATELEISPVAVDFLLTNINNKIRVAMSDPSILRTQLNYVPRFGSETEVFIEWRRGDRQQTFLAKGPLPLKQLEMGLLARWAQGDAWDALESAFDLSAQEGVELKNKLFSQRVHDYDAHYGGREGIFVRTVQIELSESEATYCLLRAFGLTRQEIAKSTEWKLANVSEKGEKVKHKIWDRIFYFAQSLDFRRAHFMLQNGSHDKVLIALPIAPEGYVLVQALNTKATPRQRFATQIPVSQQQVRELVLAMKGTVGEILQRRIFEKQSASEIAEALGIRLDTVRTFTARGTRRLGEALGEPDLNIINLKMTDMPPTRRAGGSR